MKSWQLAVVGLACLAVTGCRTDPNIAILERELRLQEDEMYRLREVVEEYQTALRSCREDGVEAGRSKTAGGEPDGLLDLIRPEGIPGASEQTWSSPDGAAPGDGQDVAPPSPWGKPPGNPPQGSAPDGPSQEAPVRDPGEIEPPIPDPPGDGAGDGPPVRPVGGTGPILPATSRQVAQLMLDRPLTRGYDHDGRPGDEGIAVGIRLHNARGRPVDAPADVSVVLLDPALADEAARVGRWDFTAADMAADFQRTGPRRAIQLEMPWLDKRPAHAQLYLFVRYTTSDGRELQTEGPIQVTLPHRTAGGWTPAEPVVLARESSRPSDAAEPSLAAPRPSRPGLEVRVPGVPSPTPAAQPAGPTIARPVWSPRRG